MNSSLVGLAKVPSTLCCCPLEMLRSSLFLTLPERVGLLGEEEGRVKLVGSVFPYKDSQKLDPKPEEEDLIEKKMKGLS